MKESKSQSVACLQTKTKSAVLLVLTGLLSLVDYLITAHLISENGYGIEGNPVLRWALHTTGTTEIILYIKAIPMLVLVLGIFSPKKEIAYMHLLLKILIGMFIVVISYSLLLHYLMHDTGYAVPLIKS